MPDLNEGQHGGVPIVLKCPLTDVQYSAHVPIVQEVGQFGRWDKCSLKQSVSSMILSFSSSQAEVSIAVNLIFRCCFICVIIDFWRKSKQEFSAFERVGISREEEGNDRKSAHHTSPVFPFQILLHRPKIHLFLSDSAKPCERLQTAQLSIVQSAHLFCLFLSVFE